ncbi:MAG: EAL domain-containing protein [Treponema sp.]|nr:EAL domain-containing protein [Treponema sp.]
MEFGASGYYILGEVITASMSILLCINILLTFSAYDKRQRLFLYAGISTFFAAAFDIGTVFCETYYQQLPLGFSTLISTLFFIFLMFTPFAMSDYVIDIAYTLRKNKKLGYSINGIVYAIYLLIVLINISTGWIFKYTPDKGYIRGPLKYLTYTLTAFYSIFILFTMFKNRKFIARRIFWVFVAYPFISIIFVVLQFFRPEMIMTGVASFSAVLFAYLTVQSYLIEVDMSTGLMTESKLKKRIAIQKLEGVLYVFSIENINMIQSSMDVSDFNRFFLSLGGVFNIHFPHNAYHITTNRFAALARNVGDAAEKAEIIQNYITDLTSDINSIMPIPVESYSAAIEFSHDDNDYDSLMDLVNNMLLKAKSKQLRKMQICDESVMVDRERKHYIYRILKRELELDSEQFQVWYQPIYSLEKRHFTYMEALSRLINTELGDISPTEFVYVAENRGLIERLGFVAFEKVCKFIAENRDLIDAVSINFSVYQMTNQNLVENVLTTLESFHLKPENIIMEITESIFIENYDLVRDNMCQLAQAGVKFYLDDFGTGYSNLANVVGLPFSTIKMDRSLVLMMEENDRGVNLFSNLVSTFKDAGLKILVEGVETNNQNNLVENIGVDYIQGFLYSRPLDPSTCVDVLRKDRAAIKN